jgi:hypothetical protein
VIEIRYTCDLLEVKYFNARLAVVIRLDYAALIVWRDVVRGVAAPCDCNHNHIGPLAVSNRQVDERP